MVSVENTGKGALNLRFGVSLKPGMNEVDPEAWEQCKSDKMTKHFLSAGRLKVRGSVASKTVSSDSVPDLPPEPPEVIDPELEPESEPEPENDDDELGSGVALMNAKDAKAFVKACRSVEILEKILEEEDRSSVITAINKRIDQLSE